MSTYDMDELSSLVDLVERVVEARSALVRQGAAYPAHSLDALVARLASLSRDIASELQDELDCKQVARAEQEEDDEAFNIFSVLDRGGDKSETVEVQV